MCSSLNEEALFGSTSRDNQNKWQRYWLFTFLFIHFTIYFDSYRLAFPLNVLSQLFYLFSLLPMDWQRFVLIIQCYGTLFNKSCVIIHLYFSNTKQNVVSINCFYSSTNFNCYVWNTVISVHVRKQSVQQGVCVKVLHLNKTQHRE